jgi:hypothetical protein
MTNKGAKPTPGPITTPKGPDEILGGCVNLARRRPWTKGFSTEALCTRILESHCASIRVQKPRLEPEHLARVIGVAFTLSPTSRVFTATTLRSFVSAALSSASAVNERMSAWVRARPKQIAHP